MRVFTSGQIDELLNYKDLIEALRLGFQEPSLIPTRQHISYEADHEENTLLTMPAIGNNWGGVKLVNVAPGNSTTELETIQGIYYLFDKHTGEPKAIFDAKSLTNWRTAAASALASSYLSIENSSVLTMIGTGALAPFLIQAHAAVRPIKELRVWGRNKSKATALAGRFKSSFAEAIAYDSVDSAIAGSDIISSATLSESPIVEGTLLEQGQHIDLVGSFKPTSREADDEAIIGSSVYVDTEAALKESGDLVIPLKQGTIGSNSIKGTLFSLCQNNRFDRKSPKEITLFKSVGYALEDLVAAQLVWNMAN